MRREREGKPEPDGIWAWVWEHRQLVIAGMAILAMAVHGALGLAWGFGSAVANDGSAVESGWRVVADRAGNPVQWPLLFVLVVGGVPLLLELLGDVRQGEFGADLLAGVSVVTSLLLGEFLAGTLVVLMFSGGAALEEFAVRRASYVLEILAQRMPAVAHREEGSHFVDIALADVVPGVRLVVLPHEVCPVDGTVVVGHGVMDESYLTGEPYRVSKAPGATVLSGSINGESLLTIRADKRPVDSRYAKIMEVMRLTEARRPRLRRLGDQLGALYTPVAVAVALVAWFFSGEATRFLAVLVVATPCPLLIAIPVAIIGTISLAARRGIVIRDPVVLERVGTCRTAIFDKTGTLTYGAPVLVDMHCGAGFVKNEVLALAASLERYSKHPLAGPVIEAAERERLLLPHTTEVSEAPGAGLTGRAGGQRLEMTGRKQFAQRFPNEANSLPATTVGLECVLLIDGRYAATFQFRDEPRTEGRLFIGHLSPVHHISRVLLVTGDRESEATYLAQRVGITEIYGGQSPEQKVEIVRRENERAPTLFVGDGINDAPALAAATVGIAFGRNSDVTTEAAGAVVLDSALSKVDELLHLGSRMRTIALQSAIGGMAVSVLGMLLATLGWLTPVAGAVVQELIDVVAVANALRTIWPPKHLSDMSEGD